MTTSKKQAGTPSDRPNPKGRFLKKSEAKRLLAQGGWTPDPENTSTGMIAHVSDQGELLFVIDHAPSVLYESRAEIMRLRAWNDTQPWGRHVLEGLLPQGAHFVEAVPSLIDGLAKRLGIPREALDGSWRSLHLVDDAINKKTRSRSYILKRPNYFAEIIAYCGEVLRKASGGEWVLNDLGNGTFEPLIIKGDRQMNPYIEAYKNIHERERGGISLAVYVSVELRSIGILNFA